VTAKHPYQSLANYAFWRKAICNVEPAEVDPVVRAPFTISRRDKVVTAGSCFAQHIGRRLRAAGFNHFVTETVHPIVDDVVGDDFSYGLFSARYGNIYTARQLLQLLRRAYGVFEPDERLWREADGSLIDPFRPLIQPGGFATELELESDRMQHFRAVRKAIEGLDVFIFTLGLTEAWESRADGAVFPVCPGVSGGEFDATRFRFVNFGVEAVVSDMTAAIEFILSKNTSAKFILTVSPVPLIATMEDRSVIVSSTYSKSVLRVAAEVVQSKSSSVAYFPSYEIICGGFNRGRYFAHDQRSVTEAGVDHVMRLFMRHYASNDAQEDLSVEESKRVSSLQGKHTVAIDQVVEALCDEQLLDGEWNASLRDIAI
jgi:hypothetical protein